MMTNAHAKALGSLGGRAGTPEQKAARRLNMLKALRKRHPRSVKIRMAIEALEREMERKERDSR